LEVLDLLERIETGEDSTTQFKENIHNSTSLAEEMVAFSNALGGLIIIGVRDNGDISGLASEDISRLNTMISNAASDHVKPPIAPLTQTIKISDKILLLIDIKQGAYKPYCTNNGTYITKSGADKRRISQEELLRLFQQSQKLFADELVVQGSSFNDVNKQALTDYYRKRFDENIDQQGIEMNRILENLYLSNSGQLTLAGLLLFGLNPQFIKPSFMVKAVSFVGNELSGTSYRDSEDLTGSLSDLFTRGMSFLTRNLHKRQNTQNFNSEGELEIPIVVLEEIMVNALIHRDYFIEAPIHIFIFDNRIEIISPGKLPNSLSVDHIKHGISVIRNPIITSFATKMLPYRGIGSGIVRAIKNYETIDFINDVELNRFKVILYRKI
jgi:ATP-dependent DNA helicase RecG